MRRWILTILILLLAALGGLYWSVRQRLERGIQLLAANRPAEARLELNRYLRVHASDERALIALAEAWARDQEHPAGEAASRAIELLDQIQEDSEFAAEARIQSARLRFLILHQPCRAEQDLKSALKRKPDSFDANYLMWKILDLTRRYMLAEPYFRACFQSAPPERHESLLTDWYFSQFSTFAAASQLDQMMGFASPGDPSDAITEYRRLLDFASNEPGCALNNATLADWCHEHHLEDEKWRWFELAWERTGSETPSTTYAVLFDVLLEAGRFEEALQVIDAWPVPRSGYEFHKREGISEAEIKNDPQAAIVACRAAILQWPGPVDWQLHHRLAGLLRRIGQVDAASKVRLEAQRLEKLMEVEFHRELRQALVTAPTAPNYLQLTRFYDRIGRRMESQAWQQLTNQVTGTVAEGGLSHLPSVKASDQASQEF